MSDIVAPEDLKKAYQLGLSNPKAELTIAQIVEKFEFTKEKARNVLNKLVQTRAASPPRNDAGSGDLVVRVREQDLALRLRNLQSVEAYLVFCIVENSGTAGIGSRDLTRGVNDRIQQAGKPPMPPQNLNKALKQLEADKIIKQIKSIHHKGRKMYIVADLEADTSVVGGVFYRDGEFDTQLVESYRERILHYVSNHSNAPLKSVIAFLKSSGFRELLVPTVHPQTGELHYTEARWPDFEELERLPCTSCPMQHTCQIEDLDCFDSIMLRQSLTTADKNKVTKARKEGQVTGLGQGALLTEQSAPVAQMNFTSKVQPGTCPYYSQWLGLYFEPCIPPPVDPAAADKAGMAPK